MRSAGRIARRFRVRRIHLVFCGILFCVVYIILYQDLGISLPAQEFDDRVVEIPLRYVDFSYQHKICLVVITQTFSKPNVKRPSRRTKFYSCWIALVT